MNLTTVARIVLGLIFTVFGLNGFFNFLPNPELPGAAGEFIGGLMGSGYFWPFLKLTESVCGILLLANRMVPLALTILAPVILNIILFHIFLANAIEAIAVPILAVILLVYLAYSYRSYYAGVLTMHTKPDAVKEEVHA